MEEVTHYKLKELRIILDSNEVKNYFQIQNVKIKEEVVSDDEPTDDLQPDSQVYSQVYQIKSEVVDSSTILAVDQLEDKHKNTKKLFSCSLCKKNNMSLANFKQHLTKKHHLSKEEILKYVPVFYQCKYCHRQFKTPSVLARHEGIHTIPFKCDKCDKRFSQKSSLQQHKLMHSEPQLPCPHCDKKFRRKTHLKVHIESTHSEKVHKCDQCKKKFKCRKYLVEHIKCKHNGQSSCKCDECGKSFTIKHYLKRHIIVAHITVSKKFVCSFCSLKFKTNDYLKKHIKTLHNSGVPIDCSLKAINRPTSCNVPNAKGVSKPVFQIWKLPNQQIKEEILEGPEIQPISEVYSPEYQEGNIKTQVNYPSESTMTVEQLEDKQENTKKLFSCSLCKKNNMSLANFKLHLINAHHLSNEEILKYVPEFYQCKYCHRQFKTPSLLHKHEGSHTLPFKCDQCDKKFGKKYNLKTHKLIHSEPQIPCPHCDMKFRRIQRLTDHIESKHSDEVHKCDQCGNKFKCRSYLRKHIKLFHKKLSSWKCDECGRGFILKGNLRKHIRRMHLTMNNDYHYSYCGKKFKTNDNLKQLIKTKHNSVVPIESNDCSLKPRHSPKTCINPNTEGVSDSVGQIWKIQNQHIKEEIIEDDGPKIQPISEGNLQEYQEGYIKTEVNSPLQTADNAADDNDVEIETEITIDEMDWSAFKIEENSTESGDGCEDDKNRNETGVCNEYKCYQCDKIFTCRSNRSEHIKIVHSACKIPEWKCDMCGKCFKIKEYLMSHIIRLHSNSKYCCFDCGKKFKQRCSLKRHIKTNRGGCVGKYKCDQCDKKFKCRRYLTTHIKLVHSACSKISKWKCDKCGKCFKCKDYLRTHIGNVHLEARFTCTYCEKKFKQNSKLKLHIKRCYNI